MHFSQKLTIWAIRLKFQWLTLTNKRKAAEKAFELFCTPFTPRPRHEPSIFRDSDKRFISVEDTQVRVYQWNPGGEKTVLILHGFGSSAYKFQRYVQLFKQKNYRVLAIDAPAHGRSEGKTVNAVQYAAAIEQTVRQFGPVQGYLAHSFGGIALALALEKIPHQPSDKVVFIAPATETTTAVAGAFDLLRLYNKEVQHLFYAHIEKLSGKPVAWFSIPRALQQIQAQVLWCHDESDRITPFSDVKPLLESTKPGLEFFITRGLGHRKIYHDSAVKNKVSDFL